MNAVHTPPNMGRLLPLVSLLLALAGWASAQTNVALTPDIRLTQVGVVRAIVTQPDGRFIVGGEFQWINDVERQNLARLNPDGSVDLTWYPKVNDRVETLWLEDTNLFAGGQFTNVAGLTRNHLAKFSTFRDGVPDPDWNPDVDGAVYALWGSSNALYAGGAFSNITGSIRSNLVKLSATGTGVVDADWAPMADNAVMALAGNATHLFAGGRFNDVSSLPRQSLVKLELEGSGWVDTNWNPGAAPIGTSPFLSQTAIQSLLVIDPHLYAGGSYNSIGGVSRAGISRLDIAGSGTTDTNWNPAFSSSPRVYAIKHEQPHLYFGGGFTTSGAIRHTNLARINLGESGQVDTNWFGNLSGNVFSVALRSNTLVAGGEMTRALGAVPQELWGLALLQRDTGLFTPAPHPKSQRIGQVNAMTRMADGSLIFGGNFRAADFLTRSNLAKVLTTGALDADWNPIASLPINALADDGSNVFVGGGFANVNGTTRRGLAKLSGEGTGALDMSWDAQLTRTGGAQVTVSGLVRDGERLYVGGLFDTPAAMALRVRTTNATFDGLWQPFGGSSAFGVRAVALDETNAYLGGSFISPSRLTRYRKASPVGGANWSPAPDAQISALATVGTNLFAGGQFTNIYGQSRSRLAKMPGNGGVLESNWIASANGEVLALAAASTDLYVGGLFTEINGVARRGLARVAQDGAGNLDSDWNVPLEGEFYSVVGARAGTSASAVLYTNNDLYVGGLFHTIGGVPRTSLARLTTEPPTYETFEIWRTNYFDAGQLGDTNIAGPFADPDGDGAPNVMEFALNLVPTNADSAGLVPTLGTNGFPAATFQRFGDDSRLVVEFVRRRPHYQPGVNYHVEFADDPGGPWTSGGVENVIFIGGSWERMKVVDFLSGTLPGKRFARLRIEPTL